MSGYIPSKTILKINELGLLEKQVMDVFNSGEILKLPSGKQSMIKKYNGYEIGLTYTTDPLNGQYVITGVWKRVRR